jgi:hypothetical protein
MNDILQKSYLNWTKEELITELQEIASQNDGKVSRDWVRKNTNIPEASYKHFFGNWNTYMQRAGLKPTRHENRVQNAIAKHASNTLIQEWSEERRSYGGSYLVPHGGRYQKIMACSDLHDIELDPFFERVWLDTVRRVQPDIIVFDGDLFDCPEFGKYPVHPRDWNAAGRITRIHDFFRSTREVAPDAQIDFIEGNHEFRLVKHILLEAPGLGDVMGRIHNWTIPDILGLPQFKINYIGVAELTGHADAQTKRDIHENNYKTYFDCVLAHHFPSGKKFAMPGFNGHHHKHEVSSLFNLHYGAYEWHQMGTGHKRNASYTNGSIWNNGFLIISVDTENKRPLFDYVTVGDTFSMSGGVFYDRQPEEFYPALTRELTGRFSS